MPSPSTALVFLITGRWLVRLGGPGLIVLGILDNSVVPLTGSMDVLTIVLAAGHKTLWAYYALMATAGGVLGGYITYAVARKGGQEAIERKLNKKRAEKFLKRFQRWGFWSVVVGAILPPPFPFVPVLLAAGGSQYPPKKFLAALTLGRGFRYGLLAFFARIYGRHIVRFFSQYYKPAVLVLGGIALIGGILTLAQYLRSRKKRDVPSNPQPKKA